MAATKIQSNAFPTTIDLSNVDLTLGAGEVLTANIADGNVTTAKIADTAIHTGKVADLAITHAKLHTDMDLSSKTVTLPTLSSLNVSGNVGVGTASPSANLEIKPAGADGSLKITSDANSGHNVVITQGYNTYITASDNLYMGVGGTADDLSIVGGNVGIGYTNPQNNLHIIGNSSFNSGSTGITIQTHDIPNAEASISLLSRNVSNENKTVNIRNVSGTFRVDGSSVYLPTGYPNNEPYNMVGVAYRELFAPSQYANANYYWLRVAYLNGRIPWLITLTHDGGSYSPGSCTFIIQRGWDNTTFYKTTLSKTGSQYFTEVRMQSDAAGGNFYLEAYGYIASSSGGYAGKLSVTPLNHQTVVCEIPVQVYAVNGSNLTYTSSNQVL